MTSKLLVLPLFFCSILVSTPALSNANLSIIKEMEAAAATLNKNLPKRIDEYTVAEKVKTNPNGIIFTYTLSVNLTDEISDLLKGNVLQMVRLGWCDKPWFNNSSYPVTATFIYNGANNSEAIFIFNKYDCN
ncbi:hypothetical protein [Providencia sp. PROV255]|uniref:hypothetical protein n=1 Tax=Providencia sp. PROV255 TaxID=2949943 RepID=UPI00234BD98E|nr:hypothetical protein [Providencia sp. PROV255]